VLVKKMDRKKRIRKEGAEGYRQKTKERNEAGEGEGS
jgi:hypothetical protein